MRTARVFVSSFVAFISELLLGGDARFTASRSASRKRGRNPLSQVSKEAPLALKGGDPASRALSSPGGMKFSPSCVLYMPKPDSRSTPPAPTLPVAATATRPLFKNLPSITGAHVYDDVLYVWLAAMILAASRIRCTSTRFRHARLALPLHPVRSASMSCCHWASGSSKRYVRGQ